METKPQIRILFSAPIWTALDYFLQNPDVENTDAEISREIKSIKKTAINIALKKLSEIGITKRNYRGKMAFNKLTTTPLITHLKIVSNLRML